MKGIIGQGAYIPRWRLERASIGATLGTASGKGRRSVASYDEDTTTLAVEAARLALRSAPGASPSTLWFSTTAPAYLDKTNATTIHAALRLDRHVLAADAGGAVRSGVAALRTSLDSPHPALVVAADIRGGLAGGPDESAGGDGAAAVFIGSENDGPVRAEYLGSASASEEFLDRWRAPRDAASKVWEERYGEGRYLELGESAWNDGLKAAGLSPTDVTHLIVASLHSRAVRALSRRLAGPTTTVVPPLDGTIGCTGAAHPFVLLTSALESAPVGAVIGLLSLADGADAFFFRVNASGAALPQARTVAAQQAQGRVVPYGKYLAWRSQLHVEPPRRPDPARVSAPAAGRSADWKFGFVGSRAAGSSEVRLPPAVPGADPGLVADPAPMAEVLGTVATFTVDRLAYSPSPPIVFAVVDFDGGGRLPLELTDVGPDEVSIGTRVEMTFRRLSEADGIINYFWKARPVASDGAADKNEGDA
jgi:3-hydroxy-3-methylglutaryl CoA synthase